MEQIEARPVAQTPARPEQKQQHRFLGLRFKITLPYVILAVLISVAGAYVVTQLIVDSLQERFANQLAKSGRLVADAMVNDVESQSLLALRSIAQTADVSEALSDGDYDELRRLALPIAVNNDAEYVEILDAEGHALLSMHRRADARADYEASTGGTVFRDWSIVERVLRGETDEIGDKFADLIDTAWGEVFYVAGPIKRNDEVIGVVLIGETVERLTEELDEASGSHVTLYGMDGAVIASTLYTPNEGQPLSDDRVETVIDGQDEESILSRDIVARERDYTEMFGVLEARSGTDLAVYSVALPRDFLVKASPFTQIQLVILIAVALLFVIVIGTLVARQITRPILQLVQASRAVATGDLDQQVEVRSRDEVGILADSFNEMVEGLRQGQFVREAFGRAVSPEVVEELLDGGMELGGETRHVTVLFSDIRSFTTISESLGPQRVVALLNEYLGMVNGAIRFHGGVVNKFVGDAVVVIFGAPQPMADHAQRAIHAGLEMKLRLSKLNRVREREGKAPIQTGIGISTGSVVAGIIGSEERWEYTVIGDGVNVASRLESLTKEYPQYDMLITAATLREASDLAEFEVDDLGELKVKGRKEPVRVYGLRRKEVR